MFSTHSDHNRTPAQATHGNRGVLVRTNTARSGAPAATIRACLRYGTSPACGGCLYLCRRPWPCTRHAPGRAAGPDTATAPAGLVGCRSCCGLGYSGPNACLLWHSGGWSARHVSILVKGGKRCVQGIRGGKCDWFYVYYNPNYRVSCLRMVSVGCMPAAWWVTASARRSSHRVSTNCRPTSARQAGGCCAASPPPRTVGRKMAELRLTA